MSYTFKSGKKSGMTLEQVAESGDMGFVNWVAQNFSVPAVRKEAEELLNRAHKAACITEGATEEEYNNRVTEEENEKEEAIRQYEAEKAARKAAWQVMTPAQRQAEINRRARAEEEYVKQLWG